MFDGFRRNAPSNTAACFSRVIRTIAAVGGCQLRPVRIANAKQRPDDGWVNKMGPGNSLTLNRDYQSRRVTMGRIRTYWIDMKCI